MQHDNYCSAGVILLLKGCLPSPLPVQRSERRSTPKWNIAQNRAAAGPGESRPNGPGSLWLSPATSLPSSSEKVLAEEEGETKGPGSVLRSASETSRQDVRRTGKCTGPLCDSNNPAL